MSWGSLGGHFEDGLSSLMLELCWGQDGYFGDQDCQNEPRWRARGCKIESRWHPGLKIRGLE